MRLRALGLICAAGALGAGLSAWVFLGKKAGHPGQRGQAFAPARPASIPSVEALARKVAAGDGESLIALTARFEARSADLAEWIAVPASLRSGFRVYGGGGKVKSMELTGAILAAFAKSEPPATWSEVLFPSRAIFSTGLSDADPSVRAAALDRVRALWTWAPDRSLIRVEEDSVAAWKSGLHADVVRRIEDPSPLVRASAVSCLAALPLDDQAAPALALLKDSDPFVRSRVLLGFAARPDLLTVEDILPMLHDRQEIANVSMIVLKTRGLSVDQIQLAKMLAHPKPEIRSSSIPILLGRKDIDASIWLIYLSRDADPAVRGSAVAALDGRVTPDARRRLKEMAASDPSPEIRESARKLVPADESTASLPPLPGSPSLNPRAN